MTANAPRPRLWVPGVAWVDPGEGELFVGSHVGFNGVGRAFAASPIGHFGAIRQWRHTAWLLERKRLTPAVIEDFALILPELLCDPEQLAHARRWLARQPLLCVSGQKARGLIDAGQRVYRVEHGVVHEDHFTVEARGGDRGNFRLAGRLEGELMPASLLEDRDGWGEDSVAVRSFVDRLLERISRGALREWSVDNALAARRLIEPGYGYHGATDGDAASVDEVQRKLVLLDALFAQIDARAADQRDDAEELRKAVQGAALSSQQIEVPVYQRAHRRHLDAVTLRFAVPEGTPEDRDETTAAASDEVEGTAEFVALGRPRSVLELDERPRWVVERVERWEPDAPEHLFEAVRAQRRRLEPSGWLVAAVLVALVAVAIWGLVRP